MDLRGLRRVNTHSHMYVSDVMQQMRGGEIKWRKMKWERKQKNIEYTTVDRPTHKQFKWKSETLESESHTSYITPKHHKHTLSVIYTTRGCLISSVGVRYEPEIHLINIHLQSDLSDTDAQLTHNLPARHTLKRKTLIQTLVNILRHQHTFEDSCWCKVIVI